MFKVSFYTPKNKESPISEFLDSSNEILRAKIVKQLKYIEEFGLTPAIPNLRKVIATPLWELRILGKDNIRIFCINLLGKKEIAIALNRYSGLTYDI